MSQGLHKAGINVIGAIDNDPICEETYKANHKNSTFLPEDIKKYPVEKLEQDIPGLEKEDGKMVFIGCSPCQHWSIIRHPRTVSTNSSNLLCYFTRFVEYYKPGFVVVENVIGIESDKNKEQSGLQNLMDILKINGYERKYKQLSCQHYGVPQTRRRFILIATRNEEAKDNLKLPKRARKIKTVKDAFVNLKPLDQGETDKDSLHRAAGLSKKNIRRLGKTEEGGGNHGWRNDEDLGIDTYRRHNGFLLNYGRMHRDKPAPTITTKFFALGSGQFGHPTEDRAISLREGALLQTFPRSYKFKTTSMQNTARLIGNAVPPEFARRIGEAIKASL